MKLLNENIVFVEEFLFSFHFLFMVVYSLCFFQITVTRGPEKPTIINKMLNDVRQMKGKQDSLDSRLITMKRENEALWRELSHLRQKHKKQQHIVNKVSIVCIPFSLKFEGS